MDKKIEFYNNKLNKIIIAGNSPIHYELHTGRVSHRFIIEKLLTDDQYFKQTYYLGYDSYEKKYMSDFDELYVRREKTFFIPISKNFIEFYKLNWAKDSMSNEYITIANTRLGEKNVESFYEFSLQLEIEGIRTEFTRTSAFIDMIYIETPKDENLKLQMSQLFGEPQNIPELENEKYGSGKRYFYYIVPISRIDKIIGIKKYRDTSTFGQQDGEQFTEEQEEIVLDLHNFDKKIYKIFKEHGMLEIEGY